jgi:hypothetical protein
VHGAFRPQRRLAPEIVDNFAQMSLEHRQKVIDALRRQKVLPELKELKAGNQPRDISWHNVAELCIV